MPFLLPSTTQQCLPLPRRDQHFHLPTLCALEATNAFLSAPNTFVLHILIPCWTQLQRQAHVLLIFFPLF
jgi:hypothetical protein